MKKLQPELLPKGRIRPDRIRQATVTDQEHVLLLASLEAAVKVHLEPRMMTELCPITPPVELGRPTFVELGTHKGLGSICVLEVLAKLRVDDARFLTFDLDFKITPLKVSRRSFYARDEWAKNVVPQLCAAPTVDAEFHEMPSWEGVGKLAREDRVVWLFVDGCHCEECVTRDIEAWVPKVVPGGLVLFHDFAEEYTRVETPPGGGQRYHGDTRRIGVWDAVIKQEEAALAEFDAVADSPPKRRGARRWFGGLRIYRRRT